MIRLDLEGSLGSCAQFRVLNTPRLIKLRKIAKEVVANRFGPDKKDQQDMLESFIRHGLTEEEAVPETLLQL
jgi:hypothetical protein